MYMIRHAQASFGSEDYDRLSELGIRQAELLGEYLARLKVPFHGVYSGPMERHLETAHKIVSVLGSSEARHHVNIAPEFGEYDAHGIIRLLAPTLAKEDPEFAGALPHVFTDNQALSLVFERAMLRWVSGIQEASGFETWPAFNERVRKGLMRLCQETDPASHIAIVTSAGAMCSVMQWALGLSDAQTLRVALHILNASVSMFGYNGNRPTLLSFNSVAHLELQLDPELLTYR
jgi:broad specificity phosphatase PhoE